MRWVWVLLIGCGGGGGSTPSGLIDADLPPDMEILVDAAKVPLHTGTITIFEQTWEGTNDGLRSAKFLAFADATVRNRVDGPCRLQFRETSDEGALNAAGTILFTGGSGPPLSMMTFPGTNQYMTDTPSIIYAAGDPISISASGGSVPAFTGSVTFPASVTVTDPAPIEAQLEIVKTGLSTAWMPTTGSVRALIVQTPDTRHQTRIECVFAGSAGSGTLGASVLASLAPDPSGSSTFLTVSTFDSAVVTAAPYEIAIDADFIGLRRGLIVP